MKNGIGKIISMSIAALLLVSGAVSAQNKVGDIVKSGNQYFIYLLELRTPEANEEFQRNLSIIQVQNSQIKHLKDQISAEKDAEKKLYLEATMKKLEAEYRENEKLMAQAYRFAENRTYKQVYFKTNICVVLTKNEIAEMKMSDGTLLDPQKMSNKSNFSMYRITEINGSLDNDKLQNALAGLMNKQLEINKLRKQLSETKDAVAQKSLNEKIVAAEAEIKKLDGAIRKDYKVPAGRDYAVEVSNSRLYMLLTDAEVKDILSKTRSSR